MALIERLRAAGRLDILKLIHFHLGSQITDIRFIKRGLGEVARFYVELRAWASTSRTWTSAAASAWTTTARSPRRTRA